MSQPPKTTVHRLAGLRVEQELSLPGHGLAYEDQAGLSDVVIRRGDLSRFSSSISMADSWIRCNGDEMHLDLPNVGRFLVRGGREIIVDQLPCSDDDALHSYLFGTVFGVLCHQRGILPLHASAIETAQGHVAFVGPSGAGKSTLVAALCKRGHQVIADDVLFLSRDNAGHLLAQAGLRRMRLWEDAVAALSYESPDIHREIRGYNKYVVPLANIPMQPRHLSRVYQLDAAPDGVRENLIRLQGAAVIELLMQNVYRLAIAELMGVKPAAFAACAAVARTVPVFRFSRPLGFDNLCQNLDFLEEHLREPCG